MYRHVSLLDSTITEALRPVMSRAFYGNDWDCVRLLSLFSLPNHEPVIVEKPCGCCKKSGSKCIAVLRAEDPQYPFSYIPGRCVQCVLSGKKCDLPLRTKIPVCTCSWLLNPADRAHEERHAFLVRLSAQQACVPRNQQWSKNHRMTLATKLRSHELKFAHKTKEALELSTDLLLGMAEVLGRQSPDLYRPDGTWVIPPKSEWQQCKCTPGKCQGHEKGQAIKKVRNLVDRDAILSPTMSPTIMSPSVLMSPSIMSPLLKPAECACGNGLPMNATLTMSPSMSNASLTSTLLQTPPARNVKILPQSPESVPNAGLRQPTSPPLSILTAIGSPPKFLNGLPRPQNVSGSSFDGDATRSFSRSPISVGSIAKKMTTPLTTPKVTPTHTPTGSISKGTSPEGVPRRRGDKIRRLSAMFSNGGIVNDVAAK